MFHEFLIYLIEELIFIHEKLNYLIELHEISNCLLRYRDYLWNNDYIYQMCGI